MWISSPGNRPTIDDLVAITSPDGEILRPMEIISSHPMSTCIRFADVLLKDRLEVQKIKRMNKDPDEFIQAVLGKWVASVGPPAAPCTWPALLDSMKKANMDGFFIEKIRAAVPSCKVANKITQWTLKQDCTMRLKKQHDCER